jgi:hypothetical protein
MNWEERALCKELHSEMWYPPLFKEDRLVPESQYYDLGKYVCENCPVIEQCRTAGADEEYGMWGGQTPKDRRVNRVRLNKMYMPPENVAHMPKRSDEPLDVAYFRINVRQWLKRRPRSR